MTILVMNPDRLHITSIREVEDFNLYYKQNFKNIIKLQGFSSGAEGHYIRAPFLEFGFRRWGEDWPGDMPPVFVANIPKKAFLDLGYKEGDYLENILGFFEVRQLQQSNFFIAQFPQRQLGKKDYRELDAMFPL